MAAKEREEIKGTTKSKTARRHSKGGIHLEQDSIRQKIVEGIDGWLHHAVDEQGLGRKKVLKKVCDRER